MCGTKALLGGDAEIIADIYRQRVETRGYGPELWGWKIAYGKPKRGGEIKAKGNAPRENQNLDDAQNDTGRFPS
jgi:formate dehydrogenase iron-sulfur subunit